MKKNFYFIILVFIVASSFIYCQTSKTDPESSPPPQTESESSTTLNANEEEMNNRLKLVNTAMQYLGTPYKYASAGKDGMDCSGLVYKSAMEAFEYKLPRSAKNIAAAVKKLEDEVEPQIGDFLFFDTTGSGVSHVGIYLGKGKFIHSASAGPKIGVVISSLEEKYWKNRFLFYGTMW